MKAPLRVALIALFFAGCAMAQQIQWPVKLDKLAAKASEVVDVQLDKKMLGMAGNFMSQDDKSDQEAHNLIKSLNGIYVKSFEFDKDNQYDPADVEEIRAQLRSPEWTRVVGVESKKDNEHVEVYIRNVSGKISGMVVLAQEPRELTFVNLDGNIDPSQLQKLGGNFGIPKVDTGHKAKPAAKPAPAPKAVQK